jgi:predicted dehydrogenase
MTRIWTRRSLLQAGGAVAAAARPAARLPRPVRVGVIGLQGHYSEVLEAAQVLPEIQVAAVAASSPREVERLKSNRALAGAKHYDDYRRMLDAEKLDAVCICDENHTRAATILACAERGLAIAAEKPLTTSLDQLKAVQEAVARHKVRLTMLLPMRFSPPYLAMKAIVDAGEVGEPVAVGAQKSYKLGLARGQRPAWMRQRSTYGGTIPYIGIHMVDLMRFTSGREFVEAAAFHSTVGYPELGEMENNTAIIYRLDNRGTASLRMDYLRPEAAPTHGDDRLRIAGTKGVVEYQAEAVTLITAAAAPRRVTDLPAHTPLFADFLESVYNGKKHLLPLEDVYRTTEIVLKTRDAADSGRVVRL